MLEAFTNAVKYLYKEDVSKELLMEINECVMYEDIIHLLEDKLTIKELKGFNVNTAEISSVLDNGGCAVAKVYKNGIHYVLVIKINNLDVYLLDNQDTVNQDEFVTIENGEGYNRKVRMVRFISNENLEYALMNVMDREVVLLSKD